MIRLLDVNVLMALLWENHEHHGPARRWANERAVSALPTRIGMIGLTLGDRLNQNLKTQASLYNTNQILFD